MKTAEIEKFIRGCEEIDRRRVVITRVMRMIESLLGKEVYARDILPGGIVLNISITEEITLELKVGEKNSSYSRKIIACFYLSKETPRERKLIWDNYGKSIPLRYVSAVYESLGKIVKRVDENVPGAGIKECFNFFIKEAPI